MRALQITNLNGPDEALEMVEVDDPSPSHPMTPGSGIVVDVEAAGVSFPELLQTRGEYQMKPELPFTPGSEVAGVVSEVAGDTDLKPGDRVAAFCMLGGFAEKAVAPSFLTFPLADSLDAAQGAGLILNYHTAWFCLVTRGRMVAGESVLIHGAAGGVGTAVIQTAKGIGASKIIGVVSSDEKEKVAREAGADEVVRSDGPWKDQVLEMTGGEGVDLVLDPVGGDRFLDSTRSLARGGRLVVIGFTGGSIPEIKVNRLLLKNIEIVGAGWGEYILSVPGSAVEIGKEVNRLVDEGHINPIVGARYPLADAAEALKLLDTRGAVGKVVLEV